MEIKVEDLNPTEIISFEHEYSYKQPTAGTDGVSFPAMPQLGKLSVVATVVAFGTVSLESQPPDLSAFRHRTIAVSAMQPTEALQRAEQYSRLREEIVASGMPMLSDEDLRSEIRERRGVRPGTEN